MVAVLVGFTALNALAAHRWRQLAVNGLGVGDAVEVRLLPVRRSTLVLLGALLFIGLRSFLKLAAGVSNATN